MSDAADKVIADDERSMEQLEERLRQQRIAASHQLYDPTKPVNCVDCGEDIAPERLAAYPRTARCTGCASEVEQRYRAGAPT